MNEAVADQKVLQIGEFAQASDTDDHDGMYDINRHGDESEVFSSGNGKGGSGFLCKKQKEKPHTGKQRKIHAGMTLDLKHVEQGSLCEKQRKGDGKRQGKSLGGKGLTAVIPVIQPFAGKAPQKKENRGEEEAVSGIVGKEKKYLVTFRNCGGIDNQSVIAVAKQADHIENRHDAKRNLYPETQQQRPYQQDSQHSSRKIPEMIKGSVKEQIFHKIGEKGMHGKIPGIKIDREIQKNR